MPQSPASGYITHLEMVRCTTDQARQLVEITSACQALVARSGVTEGWVVLQSLHTTAALTINENADPAVQHDLEIWFQRHVPASPEFSHSEGNSPAHIVSSLVGPSLSLIVTRGQILLGAWQGIYLVEWDGPRERQIACRVAGNKA